MSQLLHHLIDQQAEQNPLATALHYKNEQLNYQQLRFATHRFAQLLGQLGVHQNDRVAVYLPKQLETVAALFGTSCAGAVMVPINPQLKPLQVEHILRDAGAKILVTSRQRWQQIQQQVEFEQTLSAVVLIDNEQPTTAENLGSITIHSWQLSTAPTSLESSNRAAHELAALLYTSGSTGQPKGVMLSHQNMVTGAHSVAQYLNNHENDRLLALLPLSFDYGFSQLTTAFSVGASVVLFDYLLPRDVIKALHHYQITGLAAVPPVWIQLSQLSWPEALPALRYWTNSGGAMPTTTLQQLRQCMPHATPYLMYGLTEAFRSTFLPPTLIDQKPNSIGRAIPNAELFVINQHGQLAQPGEVGELVHRGPLVAQGYWQAPEKTAQRFRPLPSQLSQDPNERAVYSGDQVTIDEDGDIYFVGRNDEMIKCSGYRISPQELEDTLYAVPALGEVVAIGAPHPTLGQGIIIIYSAKPEHELNQQQLQSVCRQQLPTFMQPQAFIQQTALPRNANGKIDRSGLSQQFNDFFSRAAKDNCNE
ncbi:MAG: acyl-CoA ligase (AMP-forming), exosortase A system-associated [Gammaproteobacteria bacterium]|nr:acyl-CoA ligase (AMP-forming), exosortase A system-associated [Gammaproteobacteria bacterium]